MQWKKNCTQPGWQPPAYCFLWLRIFFQQWQLLTTIDDYFGFLTVWCCCPLCRSCHLFSRLFQIEFHFLKKHRKCREINSCIFYIQIFARQVLLCYRRAKMDYKLIWYTNNFIPAKDKQFYFKNVLMWKQKMCMH